MNKKISQSLIASCMLLSVSTVLHAQTIGTWYSESTAGAGVTNVSDSDTVTLTNTSGGSAAIGAVASLGQTFSLSNVGDFLQFSGDYSGQVGNNVNNSIRVGFYDSTGLTLDSDFDADMDSLVGFFGAVGTRSTTGARSSINFQPLNTKLVLDLTDSIPDDIIGSHVTPISTGNRTITYRVERIVGDVLEFRLTDGADLDITRTRAVASGPTTSFDTVAVSFNLANNLSATFDNITVAIPEPGTLALVGIALGSMLLFRRRR